MCICVCVCLYKHVCLLECTRARLCVSFITEWISAKDVKKSVYSMRETSRLFGVTVYLAS